jgi:hypothetical protein
MKRALGIFGVIGLTALISYLVIARQQAQERADRLDRALQDAEARLIQLEAEIEAAKQRLAELEHHSHVRAIQLFRHALGILDPFQPHIAMRIKQHLRARLARQCGHLADDFHGPRIAGGVGNTRISISTPARGLWSAPGPRSRF